MKFSVLAPITLLFSMAITLSVQAAELRYAAFMGNSKAGEATVSLKVDATGYSVIGRAKAEGLMAALSDWRSQFRASGLIAAGQNTLTEYHYTEKDSSKLRLVTVQDGKLSVIKNGADRGSRNALPGIDILTALFVNPACNKRVQIHTGRRGYQLQRQIEPNTSAINPPGLNQCRYKVTDKDGEDFALEVEFTEVEGLRVPKSLRVTGLLEGRMELVNH